MIPDGGIKMTRDERREAIAAQALAGMLAGGAYWATEARAARVSDEEAFTHWAVEFADKLLTELEAVAHD